MAEQGPAIRYGDAVAAELEKKGKKAEADKFRKEVIGESLLKAKAKAKALGVEVSFDWDACRTREGYYRYQGGTDCAINRAIAFGPYADLLWMETKSPILEQAKEFSQGVKAARPKQWLAYNLSPRSTGTPPSCPPSR